MEFKDIVERVGKAIEGWERWPSSLVIRTFLSFTLELELQALAVAGTKQRCAVARR